MTIWYFIVGTTTELLSIVVCAILYPFRSTKLDLPHPSASDQPHILCVHGYFHNETPWGWFKRQLKKRAEIGSVNTIHYLSLKHDIPTSSLTVKEKIEQFKQATGRDITILIGHSEGGLVSLEYALEHAPKDRLTYVITLGSPFHGTRMAKFGFGPGVKQMEIGSAYLQNLRERLLKAEHIRLLMLATQADTMIIPWESSLLKDWKHAEFYVFDNLGHVAFLFSGRVVDRIVDYLQKHVETEKEELTMY